MKRFTTNHLLWLIYIALLGVLLPHTAWAFSRFEAPNRAGVAVAWAAAFAFEASIAALTHKLAKHIETTPRHKSAGRRFAARYLNAYSVGLVTALGVSVLANLAHAVEFGQTLAILDRSGMPFGVYAAAFGAILPMVSLLFARVLSNVAEGEAEIDTEMDRTKAAITELRRELRQAEQRSAQAEQRFAVAGDLFARLFADEKRERILAVKEQWPELPFSAIAVITGASPSYISEVVNAEFVQAEVRR